MGCDRREAVPGRWFGGATWHRLDVGACGPLRTHAPGLSRPRALHRLRHRRDHPGSAVPGGARPAGLRPGTRHRVLPGTRREDVKVHEDRIDEFLTELALPAPVRADVLAWYAEHLWSPEAILAANRPYRGVLGVIRWFQLQPATCVALNTGRPEEIRDLTLQALNALGRAYRVTFRSDLLCMNPHGWGRRVAESKVAGVRSLQERGLRVVAVVDNEPAAIQAIATADQTHEILFLHADTIFESQRVVTPRTVRGTTYGLAELVSEQELRRRVQFVWHGVNDEANLRQFLASGVHWAECDVRRDPLDRLVLRHDSFEETPWHRAEHPFRLEACL